MRLFWWRWFFKDFGIIKIRSFFIVVFFPDSLPETSVVRSSQECLTLGEISLRYRYFTFCTIRKLYARISTSGIRTYKLISVLNRIGDYEIGCRKIVIYWHPSCWTRSDNEGGIPATSLSLVSILSSLCYCECWCRAEYWARHSLNPSQAPASEG